MSCAVWHANSRSDVGYKVPTPKTERRVSAVQYVAAMISFLKTELAGKGSAPPAGVLSYLLLM